MTINDNNHIWQALSVNEVVGLLSGLKIPWWIAGGYAIELFVGKKIRIADFTTGRPASGLLFLILVFGLIHEVSTLRQQD